MLNLRRTAKLWLNIWVCDCISVASLIILFNDPETIIRCNYAKGFIIAKKVIKCIRNERKYSFALSLFRCDLSNKYKRSYGLKI